MYAGARSVPTPRLPPQPPGNARRALTLSLQLAPLSRHILAPKSILHLLSHIMRSHVDKRAIRLTFWRRWDNVGGETQAAESVKQLLDAGNRSRSPSEQELDVMEEFLHALCDFCHTELLHKVFTNGLICIAEQAHKSCFLQSQLGKSVRNNVFLLS